MFNASVRFVDGRYEVKWPFKQDPPNLPVNFELARRRLVSTLRRVQSNPDLLETYHKIFQDQFDKGVIEEAPSTADGPVHHLPHHAIVMPNRETTKVRVVFDASSKPNSHFHSLNESMYRGPVFLANLVGLLLRFRCPKYAVTSDVEKAFLQISLNASHRDCTRFLWLRDPTLPPLANNLVVYRYTRVLFGATASPFLLSASIIHHMKEANTVVSNQIIESMYMDNIIRGESSLRELLSYHQEAKQLLADMHMKLHQWYSNSTDFLKSIPDDERGTREQPSVLGLRWNFGNDTLSCTVGNSKTDCLTKRSALKCTASVYDPCGWLSAVTISSKMLIQELWKGKYGWDQEVSGDLKQQWDAISLSFQELQNLSIPRRYSWPADILQTARFDLHVFCDASTKAYCAAVYLRAECGESVFCDLLFARCRVAPLKKLTVPKLELKAAKTGKDLVNFVEEHLKLPIATKTLWSDSVCVLYWIVGNKVTTPFVQANVRQIRDDTSLQFRYVPSASNPADMGSRGICLDSLKDSSDWWHGPAFLKLPESDWPESPPLKTPPPMEDESTTCFVTEAPAVDTVFDISRYSSLKKLLRVSAYVKRACKRFKGQLTDQGKISPSEITAELHFWEHRIQEQNFGQIINGKMDSRWRNASKQLGLFVDDDMYVRCRGRFQASSALSDGSKFPILLPKMHPFTKLIILDSHSKVFHFGPKHTLAKIRERYWISQGLSAVKTILLKCQICRISSGGPFPAPDFSPLPDFRVSVKKPFACVGLDYLGPLYVREGPETKKVWVSLFTCAVTRAVHLEVVASLSAADFLLALRRFAALHQSPEIIVSDNARQFKAADQLLQKTFKQLRSTSDISDYLTDKGIVWRFIVERAPWMGGFYERLVGTVKEALKKSVGKWTLTSQELQTILYEIAFVVNGRPLVYVDDDPSSPVLSPLDLLFRSTRCFPDNSGEDVFKEELTKADALLMHWRAGQNLLRQFWDIWQSHYLPSLRESSKIPQNRGASSIPVQEGAVVLIKENVPRGQWKVMPKVVEVVPGHPLSMNHTYAQGLTLHNIGITCIRQGYYYVKLLQHGQGKAAEDLITDPCLKWNPDRILSFSAKHIPNENVNFLCKSGEVMRAVLVDQLHNPGNPFRCALEEQMNLAADPRDLEFRIYNSNNEMVFTSGFKYGDWKTEVPGFNIYAHLLHELVLMILGDIPMENSLVEEFVSNPDLLKPVVPRSLLLVSDSQMRYIDKIQCGEVIPVSGGRYGEMIDVLQSPKFPLSEYQWIVVYCGINCNVKRSYAFSQQDAEWQQLNKLLIDEASTRDKPSVLFCTSFDHPTANADNPGHVASIKAQLAGTRVICVDWKDLGDPFLKPNGTMNYELFDVRGKNPKAWPKEIHISRRATRMVWKTAFCHYLQGLKFIHYTEGKAPLSVPKPVFSAPLRALPVPKPLSDDQPGSSRQAPADPPFVPPFGHQRPAPAGPMFDDHPGPSHSVASRVVVPPPNQQDRRVLFQEQVRRSPPRQSRLEPRAPTGRRAEDRHGASPPRHSRLEPRTPANRRAEDRRDYRNGDRKRQHDDKRR